MRADFSAFLQDTDGNLLACFLFQLFQSDRRAQAGRTGADDDDVIFHGLAFHRFPCHFALPNKKSPDPALFLYETRLGFQELSAKIATLAG